MLRELLSPVPIYGVGFQTQFTNRLFFLEQREKQGKSVSFEGLWKKKTDLNFSLPGVQSYLALGFPYPVYYPKTQNASISSYCVITDYHLVVKQKLLTMVEGLKEVYPGEKFKILVDSGQAFEKELGESAKIGFIGKNTLLIHPEYGSYFFIGIILSTQKFSEIYSHSLLSNGCGDCLICVSSCPPKALGDYELNASACYSYLSQSKKKSQKIPVLWGCDCCQMGCPYNLNRKKEFYPDFTYEFDSGLLNPKLEKTKYKALSANLPLSFCGYENWLSKIENPTEKF